MVKIRPAQCKSRVDWDLTWNCPGCREASDRRFISDKLVPCEPSVGFCTVPDNDPTVSECPNCKFLPVLKMLSVNYPSSIEPSYIILRPPINKLRWLGMRISAGDNCCSGDGGVNTDVRTVPQPKPTVYKLTPNLKHVRLTMIDLGRRPSPGMRVRLVFLSGLRCRPRGRRHGFVVNLIPSN